jgi:hypothetical protein
MAMMNFDQDFFNTYNWLIAEKSFKEIFTRFYSVDEWIGLLWIRYYNQLMNILLVIWLNKIIGQQTSSLKQTKWIVFLCYHFLWTKFMN